MLTKNIRVRNQGGEFEDFTLNYKRWVWLHFVGVKSLTKMLAGRKVACGWCDGCCF
jgi:hypothetical protein